MTCIYKDDESFQMQLLLKETPDFQEKGELYGIVYAPETRDSQGDIASAEVIRDAMQHFAKEGFNLDIRHNGKKLPREDAYLFEQFTVQKNDPRFDGIKDLKGNTVNVENAWAVGIKIEKQELREKYRNGEWGGLSMGGYALAEPETPVGKSDQSWKEFFVDLFSRKPNFSPVAKEDIDMNKDEIKALLKENNESLATGIGIAIADGIKTFVKPESLKKSDTPDDDKNKPTGKGGVEKPVFKGSRSNPADVKKYRLALEEFNLQKEVDWEDAQSVQDYEDKLAELKKTRNPGDGTGDGEGGEGDGNSEGDGNDNSSEEDGDKTEGDGKGKQSRIQQKPVRKESRQPVGNGFVPKGGFALVGLNKEEVEGAAEAAAFMKSQRETK